MLLYGSPPAKHAQAIKVLVGACPSHPHAVSALVVPQLLRALYDVELHERANDILSTNLWRVLPICQIDLA